MKLWIKIAVTAALLAVLLHFLPWAEVRAAFGRMPLTLWLAVLAGFLLGHRLGVEKWRMLVNAGRAALTRRDAVRCYAAGLFANLCLPSIVGGDVLRAALAARVTRRAEATVLGAVADRILDVATMAALIAGGGLLAGAALTKWRGAVLAAAGISTLLAGVLLLPLVLRLPLRRWPGRLRRPVGRGLVGLRYMVRSPSATAAAAVISLVVQSGFVLLNASIGYAIGVQVPLAVWFVAWPVAKIAALLPISLGGLGVRDATLGAVLAQAGVPLSLGVVSSLLWQSVLIAGGLLSGGLWWWMSRRLDVAAGGAVRVTPFPAAGRRDG